MRQAVSFEVTVIESDRLTNVIEQGMSVDLGPGGIGLTTSYRLEGGQVVKLFYPVTDSGTRLPVFSEVMWTAPAGNQFRSGLRFLN